MKFKKVEIQAFRAYDKAIDGTFDFKRKEDGDNADFISLYAPNGFGKTSFYDAVEYGITNNIDRFLRKGAETFNSVKSERSLRTKKKQYFLRNNNSEDSLTSYIKLYTVESEVPIETIIAKPKTKAGYDYKFDTNKTINKEFQTTILSQEWIDAFLKVDRPEERYITFIEYFGDKKIDEYYQSLVALLNQNKKRIEALTHKLNGIQMELDFNGDINILSKVNEKILALNSAGEKLKEIDNSFTETDALNLSNTLSERMFEIDIEKRKATELIKYLDIFFTGNAEIEGMAKYFESNEKIEQIDKQIKTHNILLGKFESRQERQNEIDSIKLQNDKLSSKKQALETLKIEFKEYLKISDNLLKNREENNALKINTEKLTLKLNSSREIGNEYTVKQISLQSQISKLEKDISELPKLRENIDTTNLKLKKLHEKLNGLNVNIENCNKEINFLDIAINKLTSTIENIGLGAYPSISDETFIDLSKNIIKLNEIEHTLKIENESLLKINTKIDEQEKFQKEIELFITKGSEIINKGQTNICPLCEQQYDSFNNLAQKVLNNSLLSNFLSNLLNEKTKKSNIILNLNKKLKAEKEKIIYEISKSLEINRKKLSETLSGLNTFDELKVGVISEIESLNRILNNLISKLNGKSADVFEKDTKRDLVNLQLDLLSIISNYDELKKIIISESESLKNFQNKLKNLEEEKVKLSKEPIYIKVVEYFRINYPEQKRSEAFLSTEIKMSVDKLNLNLHKETIIKKEIDDLNILLNKHTKEDIQKHLELLEKTKDLHSKIINSFKLAVNTKLNIKLNEYNIESFARLLNERKGSTQKEIEKYELNLKDYNLLYQFKENVTPFLKYEQAKIKEKDTKGKIEFLKSKISKELEIEKKRVSDYLTLQINSFFYEGLINDLYKRIDPHPDYKTVTFKCDFSDAKPKLNVCVFQTNQDELIIPNLYFSTAQLNILSLSIFFAKALNAKDAKGKSLDCIFIDDPIQSMDSINILSIIDLIRSIIVNQKKQIILSTHDENFHNLLKKKMPTNLFKSKFMELETFGKVKQDIV